MLGGGKMEERTEIELVADALNRIAMAVTPNALGSEDAAGVYVESLTEAVSGVTAGLMAVANAISDLAESIQLRG